MDEEIENPLRITLFVVLVFLLLGIYLNQYWILYSAMAFLGLALIFRTVNTYFARGWMKLARFIGTINSKVLLTLIFYLLVTPLGWLLGHDTIRSHESKPETYFRVRNKNFDGEDFEKPW